MTSYITLEFNIVPILIKSQLIIMLCLASAVSAGNITNQVITTTTRVKFDPADFDNPQVSTLTIPNKSLIQCHILANKYPDMKTFCVNSLRECILANVSYTANYDDGAADDSFICQTFEKPLIDIGKQI